MSSLGRDPEQAHERIRATVQELWGSDELRAISPTVLEEVRGGLVHFTSTLVDVVPLVYRELDRASAGGLSRGRDSDATAAALRLVDRR